MTKIFVNFFLTNKTDFAKLKTKPPLPILYGLPIPQCVRERLLLKTEAIDYKAGSYQQVQADKMLTGQQIASRSEIGAGRAGIHCIPHFLNVFTFSGVLLSVVSNTLITLGNKIKIFLCYWVENTFLIVIHIRWIQNCNQICSGTSGKKSYVRVKVIKDNAITYVELRMWEIFGKVTCVLWDEITKY